MATPDRMYAASTQTDTFSLSIYNRQQAGVASYIITLMTSCTTLKVKGGDIALNGKPISELWSVTCHMGSHSVTCHPTQTNAPCLNPSQIGKMEGYIPRWFTSPQVITHQSTNPAQHKVTSLIK